MKQFHAGEFGEWVLSLEPWQAFGTFTFEREVSTQTAARCFEDCIARHLPGVRCFYSVERHRAHGGHLHALFAGVSSLGTKSGARCRLLVTDLDGVNLWDIWKRRYGRNAIEIPRDSMHTARYCAKYITKAAALWNYNGAAPFIKRESEIETLVGYVFPGAFVIEEERPVMIKVEAVPSDKPVSQPELFPPSPCGNEHIWKRG